VVAVWGIPGMDFVSIWKTKIPLKIQIFLWLVKRNRVLTKLNLKKRGSYGSTQCVFCSEEEFSDYLFVTCPYINSIWQWIARHNFFNFQGSTLQDLWNLDCSILLKDTIIVETIRGVILWVVWLERNKVCFRSSSPRSIKSIGIQIISLTTFWSTHSGNGNIFKLSLVLPQTVDDLFVHVADSSQLVLETSRDGQDMDGNQVLVPVLPQMFGSVCEDRGF
jgi:zinc-binding in reverse transcriptase